MDLFSIWHLLIILVVVVIIFGTSKVRNIGSDLGGAIKNFRGAMKEEAGTSDEHGEAGVDDSLQQKEGRVIEGRATTEAPRPKVSTRTRRS